jgi:acetyl-CoA carboxylase carboxyl transferase subunit alpha
MSITTYEFEKPILELEQKIRDQESAESRDETVLEEMRDELTRLQKDIYAQLTPWQRVLIARDKDRPRALEFVSALMSDFIEIHGDRCFGDDKAIVTGFATFKGNPVAVICQQKGKDTKDNISRNWGMAHPEGYRKALRLMRLAEKFNLPVIVLIDTPGAFPGIGAEERGQAEAIARNIREMFTIETPIICIVIGEGASGGALGVGVGDCLLMLENSWYCVISPEGCAGILWKTNTMASAAAEQLKLTSADLKELGIADEIIGEPDGGAHRCPEKTFENVSRSLEARLEALSGMDTEQLLDRRYKKYRYMGRFVDVLVEE